MPVLGPPTASSPVASTPTASATPTPTPSPVSSGSVPPLADSSIVYEYSYSTGTGSYQLTGALGSFFPFSSSYADGAQVYYRVTDGSGQTEASIGTYSASANTLSRDTVVESTNGGAPVNWSGRTRLLIHAQVQGLPLCTKQPVDGQVLMFNGAEMEWCPANLPGSTAPADDDACDMQDVTFGTAFNVNLNNVNTQVIWMSSASGAKTTNIPACSAQYDGYTLDVGTSLGNSDNHYIVPAGGTVGGLANLMFMDGPCNAFLRCDGAHSNWYLRCLCCSTPMSGSPPAAGPVLVEGCVGVGGNSSAVGGGHPTSVSLPGLTTVHTNDIIIVHVSMNAESGPSSSVTSITSTSGLTFTKRVSVTGGALTSFFTDTEIWWAAAPSIVTGEVITVNVTSNLAFFSATAFPVSGINTSSPWDPNASLPRTASQDGAPAVPQVTGVSTTNSNTVLLFFLNIWAGTDPLTGPTGFLAGCQEGNINAFIGLAINAADFTRVVTAPVSGLTLSGNVGFPGTPGPQPYWTVIADALTT